MMDLCVGVVTLVGGGRIDRRSIQRSTMDPSNLPRANTMRSVYVALRRGPSIKLFVGAFEGILWLISHETIEKRRYIGST